MKIIKGKYWKYQGEEYELKLVFNLNDALITSTPTFLPHENKFDYNNPSALIYIEQHDAIAKFHGAQADLPHNHSHGWVFSTPEQYQGSVVHPNKKPIYLRLSVEYKDLCIRYEEINSCQVCNKSVGSELMFQHSNKWHCFDCSMGFNESYIEAVDSGYVENYIPDEEPY